MSIDYLKDGRPSAQRIVVLFDGRPIRGWVAKLGGITVRLYDSPEWHETRDDAIDTARRIRRKLQTMALGNE